jgi:Ohr subfamily peroxiredoxin
MLHDSIVHNRLPIMMSITPLYSTTAHATGDGRNGHVQSDDGIVDLDVRMPTALGGGGSATNPEQLFAAGFAACFHSALRLVAKQAAVDVTDSEVSATVHIGTTDAGGFGLAVELDVSLPAAEREDAERVAELAHEVCPYSNATRGNIAVTVRIV